MNDAPGPLTRAAESLMQRFGLKHDDLIGFRFAINVFIATAIVYFTIDSFSDKSPIWAIASMVAASDPLPEEARRLFRSRIINVLVGCAVGMIFLVLGNQTDWMLPFALATTVLISSYMVRVKTMWRQAPITAAIVIASGLAHQSMEVGIESGLRKVVQVIFGCVVGMMVSWGMSKVWLIKPKPKASVTGTGS